MHLGLPITEALGQNCSFPPHSNHQLATLYVLSCQLFSHQQDELARKFGTEADITAMLELMMNEYAGNDVLEEPEELQKRLLDFNSDILVTGLCDMAAAIPGNGCHLLFFKL